MYVVFQYSMVYFPSAFNEDTIDSQETLESEEEIIKEKKEESEEEK